jgi:hypothetical protein
MIKSFLYLISGCAELFYRSTHASGELRQLLRTEQEQHDEQDHYRVRPHKIEDTSDCWSHKLISLSSRLFFTYSTDLPDLYSHADVERGLTGLAPVR